MTTDLVTMRFKCRSCGAVYVLALGMRARAPHGPQKDCTARDGWEMLPELDDPE